MIAELVRKAEIIKSRQPFFFLNKSETNQIEPEYRKRMK